MHYGVRKLRPKPRRGQVRADWRQPKLSPGEEETIKLAGKEVIDVNFLAQSEETDRELAEADVTRKYHRQPYVDYVNGVKLPVDPSTLRVAYTEPYVPRGADLPTGQYL